ncbi:glycoside hydrolase family 43 [Micromonospora maris AB-18-032]|nr:glycoside hydrolase family 43 [Micromonospora maris AB-18-032]
MPDPDVVFDGRYYYMVSTTMYFAPSVPIMRSSNLVHWSIAGYAAAILDDADALALRKGQDAYGQGSWAASIRFHDGTYYMSVGSLTTQQTYVYSTPNIERGPCSRSVLDGYAHDQSLLFDGDDVWLVYGGGSIDLRRLRRHDDGTLGWDGPATRLVEDANVDQTSGLHAEGAHAYKIGDYYYVFMIEWPSGGVRQEVLWRSPSLTPQSAGGAWEGRVVLSQGVTVGGRPGTGVAQGGIVQTYDGQWYAMLFQDEGPLGRSPHLFGVTCMERVEPGAAVAVKPQPGQPVLVAHRAARTPAADHGQRRVEHPRCAQHAHPTHARTHELRHHLAGRLAHEGRERRRHLRLPAHVRIHRRDDGGRNQEPGDAPGRRRRRHRLHQRTGAAAGGRRLPARGRRLPGCRRYGVVRVLVRRQQLDVWATPCRCGTTSQWDNRLDNTSYGARSGRVAQPGSAKPPGGHGTEGARRVDAGDGGEAPDPIANRVGVHEKVRPGEVDIAVALQPGEHGVRHRFGSRSECRPSGRVPVEQHRCQVCPLGQRRQPGHIGNVDQSGAAGGLGGGQGRGGEPPHRREFLRFGRTGEPRHSPDPLQAGGRSPGQNSDHQVVHGRAQHRRVLAYGSFDAGGGLPGPGDEHPQPVGDRKAGLGGCQRGRRTTLEQPPQQCRVPAPGKRIRAGSGSPMRADQPCPDGLGPVVVKVPDVQQLLGADALGSGEFPGPGPDRALGEVDRAQH